MIKSLQLKIVLLLCLIMGAGTAWGQSDYSSNYSGNITLSTSGGTSASLCKVSIGGTEYDGIKVGSGSAGGAMTITVPAGAKYLHVHVAAWNGVTGLSLNITPNSNISPTSISLTANSGISSNSPFTFSGDASTSDYYKVITFTNALASSTTFTFTTSAKKRFVIWGVTSEEASSTYSVTYNANGATSGSVPTDANAYTSGATVTVLGNTGSLAKTGYAFGGWNTANNGSGSNYTGGDTFTISANTTLYAKWNPYTITAESNNNSYGTVSLDGYVITATPSSGYTYADPAYTVTAGTASVSQSGDEFTVTPSSDCTVRINFEAIPCYTVTLSDDTANPMTEYSPGVGVTLPSRSNIGSYEFAGWSPTNVPSETTTAPESIIPAGTYYPTANITLYPVYTKDGGGAAAPSAFSVGNTGDYAIVSAAQNGKYYALPVQPTLNNGKITAQEITVSESNGVKYVTTANASDFTWTIAAATNGYTLSDGNGYIYHSNGGSSGTNLGYGETASYTWAFTADDDYVTMAGMSGTTTNSRGMLFQGTTIGGYSLSNATSSGYYKVMILPISAGTTTYYWSNPVAATVETPVITVEANPFVISTTATITCATEGATIKYSYDNSTWSDYSAALTITETKTIYAKAIKGSDESVVASVEVTKNLANPTVAVSGDLTLDLDGGTDISAGTLTAAVTYNNVAVEGATVTWSSSDTDIATIDASTGAVTIKTTGEVTFTATYAGNSDYAEATGTKTVTVIDSNAPIVGTINFGNNGTKINAVSVTGDDSNGNAWTITTAFSGDTSFSQQPTYSQVGSANKPATSITFTMTLPAAQTITSFTANFGGFNGTTGAITLKVGNAIVGTGSLNASNDVTVTNSSSAIGTTLTVTVTGIDKGVKCYSISYTIAEATTVPVTIKAGFPATTFSADCALDFTEVSGVTAYIITDDDGSTTAVTTVPANTGLYIEGAAGTYNIPLAASTATLDDVDDNKLIATTAGTTYKTGENNKTYYAYGHYTGNGEDKYAFMKVKTTGLTPGAGKALLEIDTPVGGAKELIEINGGATSIDEELRMTDEESAGAIYDLSGRRVIAPTKGLYIVNGKKLMVK